VALAMWRSGRYALLLTDCHMPHMDGFELTAAIRQAEPAGARLPIIAVTANAMQGEAQRCCENDMDDYLAKPLRLSELGPMLGKWLPLSAEAGHGAAGGAQEKMDEVQPALFPVWDASTLFRLVGDNPALHRRLLEKFLLTAQTQVMAIGVAVTAGETDSVTDEAHKLKSTARTVGALRFGEVCEAMEVAGRAANAGACGALVAALGEAFVAAADEIRKSLSSQERC
jgi:CheY-like chemotaxis protein